MLENCYVCISILNVCPTHLPPDESKMACFVKWNFCGAVGTCFNRFFLSFFRVFPQLQPSQFSIYFPGRSPSHVELEWHSLPY